MANGKPARYPPIHRRCSRAAAVPSDSGTMDHQHDEGADQQQRQLEIKEDRGPGGRERTPRATARPTNTVRAGLAPARECRCRRTAARYCAPSLPIRPRPRQPRCSSQQSRRSRQPRRRWTEGHANESHERAGARPVAGEFGQRVGQKQDHHHGSTIVSGAPTPAPDTMTQSRRRSSSPGDRGQGGSDDLRQAEAACRSL